MSGRKHRPVLYEVVRRSRLNAGNEVRRISAPAAATPRPAETEAHAPALLEADGNGIDTPDIEADAAPQQTLLSDERRAYTPGAGLPAWTSWLAEGRLHLSVGWISASVVGVALVLVLFVTFQAGMRFASPGAAAARETPAKPDTAAAPQRTPERQSPTRQAADLSVFTPPRNPPTTPGSSAAAPPIAAVTSAPPATPPTAAPDPKPADAAESSADAAASAAMESDAFDFEAGTYYLVIQHFHRDQGAAAKQAQEFLKSNGVECVLRVSSKDIRMFATRAFRLSGGDAAARKSERTALDELKRRVKELGKEYTRTRAKGYAFDQCYELKQ